MLEDESPDIRIFKSVSYSPLKIVTAGVPKNFNLTQNHLLRLTSILGNLKNRVELIFFDLPPVLSSSECISLCRLCDAVILVVRSGETRWEVMQEARRRLERAEVQILGGVLNRREYFIPAWAYRNL